MFALTNAICDRDTTAAIFYLNSLLADSESPMRPEQIIVAVLNQIRKLLLIKEFVGGPSGRVWSPGCSFGHFKSVVLPALVETDRSLQEQLQQWRQILVDDAGVRTGEKAKPRKTKIKKPSSDLFLVKNPNNPYPIYQLFVKSERFSMDELLQAFEHLAVADHRIKSGTENKKTTLETAVVRICGWR